MSSVKTARPGSPVRCSSPGQGRHTARISGARALPFVTAAPDATRAIFRGQPHAGFAASRQLQQLSRYSQDCAPVCGVLCTVGLVSRRCAECGDYTGAGPGTQFGSARPPARSRHTDLVPGSDITLPVVVAPGRDHRAVHAQTQGVPGSRRHGQDAVPPAH